MSDDRRKLIQEIMETMSSVRGSFHHGHGPMFMKHGIAMPHLKLMMKMDKGEGVTVKDLAETLGVSSAAVTQFVDHLVDKGWVERVEDQTDRRLVRVKLSAKAKDHFKKIKDFHFDRMSKIFENLSDKELQQLISLIKKIKIDEDNFKYHKWWHYKRDWPGKPQS